MEPARGLIRVSVAAGVFEVADAGPGIPESDLPFVFDASTVHRLPARYPAPVSDWPSSARSPRPMAVPQKHSHSTAAPGRAWASPTVRVKIFKAGCFRDSLSGRCLVLVGWLVDPDGWAQGGWFGVHAYEP
jgi:hypothetical protein